MAAKKNKASSRVVIGVDPHKRIDAVVVLDELGAVLAREIVPHTSAGFKTLKRPRFSAALMRAAARG